MGGCDRDAIDLVEPGYLEFAGDGTGEFAFVAVRGWLDSRPLERDGRLGVEFTWAGVDECDPASGRGWAVRLDGETIEGRVFFHLGDDSTFRAEPFAARPGRVSSSAVVTDPGYRDVTCSFCGRHNRQVHMVQGRDELRICQVCVAAAADVIDTDVGVPSPPGGWSIRWTYKT